MARLGQVARYSAKGDRNAHVTMEDPLENRGYALWIACQGKIRTTKAQKVPGPADRGVADVMGYEIEVNLKRKCFDLWPGLNQMDKPSQDSYISEIYSYLRQSGNAICVRKPGLGEHGIPLWWLREHWNDVKAVGVYRQTELTRAEKRLTPEEAGEDRDPMPVTVRQREEEAARREAAAAESPALMDAKIKTRAEQILAVIKSSPQPLYQREITEATDLTSLMVGRILRELQEEGKVYRRQEGRGERPDAASGRYRYLYWDKPKIPLRKTPLDIGNATMERVWDLKPGETLKTSWMSPGNRKRVAELVEQGLLEYTNEGTADERIRLAPATPSLEQATEETSDTPTAAIEVAPPVSAEKPSRGDDGPVVVDVPTPPRAPMPAPPAHGLEQRGRIDVSDIAGSIERLIAQLVEQRLNEGGHLDAARQEVVSMEQRARRAEGLLIGARAELSAVTRERDELKQRLDAVRAQLGL